jgi:hypothetical protein
MEHLSDTSRVTEVILIYKHGRPQWHRYIYWSYTYLLTWKTSVTPVYVLKLSLFTNMEDLSDTGRCTEVILIYKHGRPQWHRYMCWSYTYLQTWKISVTLVNVLGLYTNLQTWKTSVTPVDVLTLYSSTNMEDVSDTGWCTEVIPIYKHGRPQWHR